MCHDGRPRARESLDERAHDRSQRYFAEIAERKAGDCHADLHAGHHAAQIADQVLDDFGAGITVLDQLSHPRKAHRDERKLRRSEERVHGNQENDAEQVQRAHRTKPFIALFWPSGTILTRWAGPRGKSQGETFAAANSSPS
jgi:hypothetical protein